MKQFLRILKYGSPYRHYAVLNILFNIVSIIAGLFSITLIMPFLKLLFDKKQVMTQLVGGGSFNQLYNSFMAVMQGIVNRYGELGALLFICILIVIMILVKNAARYFALYYLVIYRNYAIRDIRAKVYDKVLRLPLSYFTEEKKGDIMSRMSNDIKEIEWAIMSSLEAMYKEPLTIVFYLGWLIYMSPQLSLFVFLLLPVTALVIGRIGRSLRKPSGRNQERMGSMMSLFEETLSGIRIIKAFNAEKFFRRRYKQENGLFTTLNIFLNRRGDMSSPLSETLSIIVLAVLLWFGGNMVFDGHINAEVFLGYIGIFTQIISPAKAFSSAFYTVQRGTAASDRIEEIINAEETIVEPASPEHLPAFSQEIRFNNVSFGYTGEPVLQNINLTIKKGQTVALVGPSGGGKSTLADLLPRFYDVTSGNITIDGIDIRDIPLQELRNLMGIVSQESILFNDTIYNNIAFGKTGVSGAQVLHAAQVANAEEFISQTEKGYQANIGDRGSKLSGGQRQRVSIARAVLKNPDILILDEATSALDTTSERLVQDALNNLMQNRTSVVIAHRLSTIQNADLIVVLEQGRIIQTGTHQELINQEGLYRKLNQMQQLAE